MSQGRISFGGSPLDALERTRGLQDGGAPTVEIRVNGRSDHRISVMKMERSELDSKMFRAHGPPQGEVDNVIDALRIVTHLEGRQHFEGLTEDSGATVAKGLGERGNGERGGGCSPSLQTTSGRSCAGRPTQQCGMVPRFVRAENRRAATLRGE